MDFLLSVAYVVVFNRPYYIIYGMDGVWWYAGRDKRLFLVWKFTMENRVIQLFVSVELYAGGELELSRKYTDIWIIPSPQQRDSNNNKIYSENTGR